MEQYSNTETYCEMKSNYQKNITFNTSSDSAVLNESVSSQNPDELIFNPYNPLNKEITLSDVKNILNKYGIYAHPHNLKLYQRAFVHVSYTKRPKSENEEANIIISPQPEDCLPLKTKSNERLEFIGDGILECITKYYLYRRFPKADEGFMTEKKIALVKNEHIGKLAQQMNLNKWFIISKHAEEKNTRNNLKKLGCLFEAFIGALFLDFNKEIRDLQIQNYIKKHWLDYTDYFSDLSTFDVVNTQINWNYYYNKYKEQATLICPNNKELANYAVRICYVVFPKKSKKFIWVVASEGLIDNIKQVDIELPIRDKDGIYEYLGRNYSLQKVELNNK
jgi:dsRNA-specific ribonuclease